MSLQVVEIRLLKVADEYPRVQVLRRCDIDDQMNIRQVTVLSQTNDYRIGSQAPSTLAKILTPGKYMWRVDRW